MSAQPQDVTVAELETILEATDARIELIDGRVQLRAAGFNAHADTIANLMSALFASARAHGGRAVSESLMRVTADARQGPFPDVAVYCEADLPTRHGRANPCLVVEVLSRSTAADDRGRKRRIYLAVESVNQYLVVDTAKRVIDEWQPGFDAAKRYAYGDTIHLTCPPMSLDLATVFA